DFHVTGVQTCALPICCALSSYATGHSPNMQGVCSPAHAVRWEETAHGRESRLNGVLIDRYAPGEPAGYPTLCKGRFRANEDVFRSEERRVGKEWSAGG